MDTATMHTLRNTYRWMVRANAAIDELANLHTPVRKVALSLDWIDSELQVARKEMSEINCIGRRH